MVTNRISQGDPLSMIFYILYNADLLEIINNLLSEEIIGYVDNIAIIVIGENFKETTNRIKSLMTKEGGRLQWSIDHNSCFKVTKFVIVHFSKKTIPDPDSDNGRMPLPKPTLIIENQLVQEVKHFRYLGIIIDTQLKWKEQAQRATANATKWILQLC